MNKKNKNKGFSLIELIIAIAILVILTGLLAPQFMKYIEKSREAKDMQALDTVYSSVQAALGNEGAYDQIIQDTADNNTGNTVKIKLSAALSAKDTTDSFNVEMQSLVGKSAPVLKSKKANGSEIYIAIKYTNSTVEVDVPTTGDPTKTEKKTVETFGGFEVMVYSSENGSYDEKSLEFIGANLTADLAKALEKK